MDVSKYLFRLFCLAVLFCKPILLPATTITARDIFEATQSKFTDPLNNNPHTTNSPAPVEALELRISSGFDDTPGEYRLRIKPNLRFWDRTYQDIVKAKDSVAIAKLTSVEYTALFNSALQIAKFHHLKKRITWGKQYLAVLDQHLIQLKLLEPVVPSSLKREVLETRLSLNTWQAELNAHESYFHSVFKCNTTNLDDFVGLTDILRVVDQWSTNSKAKSVPQKSTISELDAENHLVSLEINSLMQDSSWPVIGFIEAGLEPAYGFKDAQYTAQIGLEWLINNSDPQELGERIAKKRQLAAEIATNTLDHQYRSIIATTLIRSLAQQAQDLSQGAKDLMAVSKKLASTSVVYAFDAAQDSFKNEFASSDLTYQAIEEYLNWLVLEGVIGDVASYLLSSHP